MKRTYVKLSSEILMVETESSFMGASVRLQSSVTVEEYKSYGWEGATLADPSAIKDGAVTTDGAFNVTFD